MQQQPCKLDCGNTATLKCSQCKQAYYCSQICQRVDWQHEHRLICHEIAAPLAATADLRNYYYLHDEVQMALDENQAIGDDPNGGDGGDLYRSIIKDMLHMAFVKPLGSITTGAEKDLGGVAERVGLSYDASYSKTLEAVQTMIKSLQLTEKQLIATEKKLALEEKWREISSFAVPPTVPSWLISYIVKQGKIINVKDRGTRVVYDDHLIPGGSTYLMQMWFDGQPFITNKRVTNADEFKLLWGEKTIIKNPVPASAKHLRGPYEFTGTVFWYWSEKESTRPAKKK